MSTELTQIQTPRALSALESSLDNHRGYRHQYLGRRHLDFDLPA
jgi:hypothetical protein